MRRFSSTETLEQTVKFAKQLEEQKKMNQYLKKCIVLLQQYLIQLEVRNDTDFFHEHCKP